MRLNYFSKVFPTTIGCTDQIINREKILNDFVVNNYMNYPYYFL